MSVVRKVAIEELLKILQDDEVNPNTKIKAIATALQHTERMAELAIQVGQEAPKINVDMLIKQLEDM
jgi:uncharacterized UPF0146 family protein